MNYDQQRGRSPSAGHNAHLTSSASASPHPQTLLNHPYQQQPQQTFGNPDLSLGGFNQPQQQFNPAFQQDAQQYLDPQSTLLDFSQAQFQNPGQSLDIAQQTFMQGQSNLPTQQNISYFQQPPGLNHTDSSDHLSPGSSSVNLNLNVPSPYSTSSESTNFPSFDLDASAQALEASFLYGQQQQQQAFDPSSLSLDVMATTHNNPTPPHLLQGGLRRPSQSPSPHSTPNFQQSPFNDQSARPRSESLDPASAAYPRNGSGYGNQWACGQSFQTHRRQPSDTYSDISTHSAQASPYLGAVDSFDVSPMLGAQDPALFDNALGLSQFSLSDGQLSQSHVSPGQSPHISPNIMPQFPQQPLPEYTPLNNFGYSTDPMGQNMAFSDSYQNNVSEPFPQLSTANSPGDFGQADVMSPPEINIDFAPPSRQPSFGPPATIAGQEDALSPPERSKFRHSLMNASSNISLLGLSRNRSRAKSDSAATGSRPATPAMGGRGRSPSLQPISDHKDSLSPHHIRLPTSRSPSPSSVSSVGGNRSRASSASSAPQRDYILDLANPDRGTGPGNDPKRVQKHPANFQCHLCPKKFTRAYNLRSHLRTHTDERPFVCTVCGKAFARQHDRKRHEGLHSGEKKFVCKGVLSTNDPWGCGRRFARADALGRHFRSEAGRVCIRPLLDEEAAERQRQWAEEQAQQQMQSTQGFVAPPPMTVQPQLHPILPAALLQTYPELASFDWSGTNTGPISEEVSDYGRSSFDASSGGEWDGLSENEMGSSFGNSPQMNGGMQHQRSMSNGMNNGMNNGMSNGMNNGMSNGSVWNGQPDYLSDFEGR